MDSGTAGLIGVVVGAGLTTLVKLVEHLILRKRATHYLVARVAPQLQRFVVACAKAASDYGEEDADGDAHAATARPEFSPASLDVEWKTLPPRLMYAIWNLPNRAEFGEGYLDAVAENDFPSDGSYLLERRLTYANLGLEANDILMQLLSLGKLPAAPIDRWDPVDVMTRERDKINEQNAKWQSEQAQWVAQSPLSAA
ncbi:hypothetical protein A3K87_20640 [Variovorax paradoxus]|uniref:Uncharacterized protein n=1 Tax=Variovorax paradoxus TaxID=34073 RepID=A0AA91DLJ6_VARPD|nr:hypothetical protein [Variovorax paradoxus]OAK61697.1 hypothetical protein A3K87_20640 [Variovorax paradoxus]